MTSPTLKGITTIKWGTSDILGSPASAIVESISITDPAGNPIEIEDNDGHTAVEVLLDNGFDATVTALYDSAKSWPSKGDSVTLTTAIFGAKSCLVVAHPEQNSARKRETTITLKLAYRPQVSL